MFGIFKRRAHPRIPEGFGEAFAAPVAMAVAMAQATAEHAAAIHAGTVQFPIHKAEGLPVLTVWKCLRLEACIAAMTFGEGSLFDLADRSKQADALSEFLDNAAHLQFPQPSGTSMAQSVQAMFQAYVHLSKVGSELCDRETDHYQLARQGKDIVADLSADAVAARRQMEAHVAEQSSQLPPTLFDLFFADLNRKTKSIAFSRVFGPEYEREIAFFVEHVRKEAGEDDATLVRQRIAEILAAPDPDTASEQAAAR